MKARHMLLAAVYLTGAFATYGHEAARWERWESPLLSIATDSKIAALLIADDPMRLYRFGSFPVEFAALGAGAAWPVYVPLRIAERVFQ